MSKLWNACVFIATNRSCLTRLELTNTSTNSSSLWCNILFWSQMSEKWGNFTILTFWQATQSFASKSHLTKCTLFTIIQRFVIFWSFYRRIRHMYNVRMSAKWRNLAIFVIFAHIKSNSINCDYVYSRIISFV